MTEPEPLPGPSVVELDIAAIELNAGTQPRAITARDRYVVYAEDMKRGDAFPPVIVFTDASKSLYLGDGFHRVRARQHLAAIREQETGLPQRPIIEAEVRTVPPGESAQRAALLHACGANHGHGIPRSPEDKRLAVSRLLTDPEWSHWSDHRIADWCHVSRDLVSSTRRQLEDKATGRGVQSSSVRTVARADGTTYKLDTANLAAANRARAAASTVDDDGDDPLGGGAGRSRPTGYRETQVSDLGLRVENSVSAATRALLSLPPPAACAAVVRGLDVVLVERASMWLADFVEELSDRRNHDR